jgi:excinuclease ABC subunit A
LLEALAEHYGFDVDTPWKKLPKKVQNAILNGSGKEEISFYYYNDRGRKVVREHTFRGRPAQYGSPLS